jgi:hypothetical protein
MNVMDWCHEIKATHERGIHSDTNILSFLLRIFDH